MGFVKRCSCTNLQCPRSMAYTLKATECEMVMMNRNTTFHRQILVHLPHVFKP